MEEVVGDSGRQYVVQKILQEKEGYPYRVYLATLVLLKPLFLFQYLPIWPALKIKSLSSRTSSKINSIIIMICTAL